MKRSAEENRIPEESSQDQTVTITIGESGEDGFYDAGGIAQRLQQRLPSPREDQGTESLKLHRLQPQHHQQQPVSHQQVSEPVLPPPAQVIESQRQILVAIMDFRVDVKVEVQKLSQRLAKLEDTVASLESKINRGPSQNK
jgi:hypothetical protein